jgi:hypothetical protein
MSSIAVAPDGTILKDKYSEEEYIAMIAKMYPPDTKIKVLPCNCGTIFCKGWRNITDKGK